MKDWRRDLRKQAAAATDLLAQCQREGITLIELMERENSATSRKRR